MCIKSYLIQIKIVVGIKDTILLVIRLADYLYPNEVRIYPNILPTNDMIIDIYIRIGKNIDIYT